MSIVEQSIRILESIDPARTPMEGVRYTDLTCEPSGTIENIIF